MNLTKLHPKSIENFGEKAIAAVNIRFAVKASDIGNVSQNIRSDV